MRYSGSLSLYSPTELLVQLKDEYMHHVVEKSLPFTREAKDRVSNAISRTINMYSKCVTRGDHSAALRQLRVHQREHVRPFLALPCYTLNLVCRSYGSVILFGAK